jgi:hypothetical protein
VGRVQGLRKRGKCVREEEKGGATAEGEAGEYRCLRDRVGWGLE